MSIQSKRCVFSMHTTFFIELPVSLFLFHLSLLTTKSVDLMVTHNSFFVKEIVHIDFDLKGALNCDRLGIADNKA